MWINAVRSPCVCLFWQASDPCGVDFSAGPQPEPCDHTFCRHCLEAELAVSWGCPTCGDNPVWKFETRWKGCDDIVEARAAVADEIAALRCHCRHGCHCSWGDIRHEHAVVMPLELSTKRQAQLRAELLALRQVGEELGPPGGGSERHHRAALMARLSEVDNVQGLSSFGQRRRLLQQHAQEVEQLLATRHAELGWTANDDGCGAVVPLGDREPHQQQCYKAVAYETTCFRHAALYWVMNTGFVLLWAVFLLPELWRCEEDAAAALRAAGHSGPESDELAEAECRVWTRWDFPHAVGWVAQLVLGCISATHWALDLLMIRVHASSVARQQRLRLLPDLSAHCGAYSGQHVPLLSLPPSLPPCLPLCPPAPLSLYAGLSLRVTLCVAYTMAEAGTRDEEGGGWLRACTNTRLAESWSLAIVLSCGGGVAVLWTVRDLGFL